MQRNTAQKLRGIFAPIATPFKDNENLDIEAMQHNLSLYRKTEMRGYLALGSNGENKSLTEDERLTVLRTVLDGKGDGKTVVAGVMYEAQRHAEQFIRRIADLGADFALIQSPSYFRKLMTDDTLYDYFSALADYSPIPVLLYNSPGFNGITLSQNLLQRLADHPNIVGMKDSTPGCNLDVMKLNSPTFHVMAGSIRKLKDFLRLGSIGATVSLANYCPDLAAQLYARLLEDAATESLDLNGKLVEMNQRIAGAYRVPGVKAAMNLLGFTAGIPRRPLHPLDAGRIDTVKSVLIQAGVLAQ